ncbi:IS110 family transposase [Pseudonocardia sp. NPDC049635]|uniref:IS110 family transposase n=1 Tax=Pseudonocardia sp. NPDC049635 TaxID=3155506 RepID=UPI0033F04EB1
MPIVAPTTTAALVAESYDLLVGVDTHAATHTYAIVDAATGALVEHREFPTSPAGLRRAQDWINRRTDHGTVLVLVDGAGSYGAVLTEQLLAAGTDLAEAPDITRQVRHTSGKSDIIDAAELARAARGLQTSQLRRPRQGGDRTILRVLSTARDQMTGERTRTINALTALLRTVDLGVDARRALSAATIATIAGWRTTTGTATARTVCRGEAIRLARRVRALDTELAANHAALTAAVSAQAPELLEVRGVGPVVAATVLQAWSHPGRVRSEAAFASLAGVAPLQASSGNTRRHRLNRGGDRRLNRALYTIALTRLGHDPRTRAYRARRAAEGATKREIIRILKRYISRELFRLLTATHTSPMTT